MKPVRIGSLAPVIFPILAAFGAAACTDTARSDGSACRVSTATADSAIAAVFDGSVSSTDVAYTDATVTWLLDQALARQAGLSVATFGGSDAEIDVAPCLNGAAFVAPGANDRLRTGNTPAFVDNAASEIAQLRRDFGSTDPAAAYRGGVSMLQSAGQTTPRLLVIETDGVATAGCAALPAAVDPADETLIPRLIAACTPVLPDASGVDVLILGIGHTGNLSSESVQFLTELNLGLCAATGAASCNAPATRPNQL